VWPISFQLLPALCSLFCLSLFLLFPLSPPLSYPSTKLNCQQSNREFISPEGLRLDGRRANEVRKIECQLGVFSRVDGSAYYEQGNTKVVVSVYGPRQPKFRFEALHDRAKVYVEYGKASFSTTERKEHFRTNRQHTEAALVIQQTFESIIHTKLYPKSQINIFVQILQSDGGKLLIERGRPLFSSQGADFSFVSILSCPFFFRFSFC